MYKVVAGYNKVDGKYKPYYRPEYKYDNEFETFFPVCIVLLQSMKRITYTGAEDRTQNYCNYRSRKADSTCPHSRESSFLFQVSGRIHVFPVFRGISQAARMTYRVTEIDTLGTGSAG